MYRLSEINAESSRYNEVLEAGKKLNEIENATEKMSPEEKKDLINQVKENGSVDLDKDSELDR